MEDSAFVKKSKYSLYVINSNYSITDIKKYLKKYASSSSDIGPIRNVYSRNKQTGEYTKVDQQLVILRVSFYDFLLSQYNSLLSQSNSLLLNIEPYIINKNEYSYNNSSVMHYYFPLNKENNNIEILKRKMTYFSSIEMINLDDWHIHDSGVCEFSETVSDEIRIYIKAIIDIHTDFRVSWCRKKHFNRITLFYQ